MSTTFAPGTTSNTDLLDWVQKRVMRTIRGLEQHHCKKRLRELGLFSTEKRLTVVFPYLKGAYRTDGDRLFITACRDITRESDFKLKEERIRSAIRKEFFLREW